MAERMSEIEQRVAAQAGLSDDELPVAPDPNLEFWMDTAKGLLGESIKSIEEAAKQIIAIAFSDIRGGLGSIWTWIVYLLPLLLWLLSLLAALLVFFPRTYQANISSWRESRAAFERVVAYKHDMLKVAGLFLFLGAAALAFAMGVYLAG